MSSYSLPGMSSEELAQKLQVFGLPAEGYQDHPHLHSFPSVEVGKDRLTMWRWCHNNLGNNWLWIMRSNIAGGLVPRPSPSYIYFLHEQDKLIFKLTFKTT